MQHQSKHLHARMMREIAAETAATAAWTGIAALSPRTVAALGRVRRAAFVPQGERGAAYVNAPLPIGHGQTISQPFIVALMTELAAPGPHDIVLEVGTGSGYQAAVLAELAARVYSIEVVPELAARAEQTLRAEGHHNVVARVGDGAAGWPEHAPFDAIVVTAAAPEVPPALLAQLKPGGRMVIPVGMAAGEQRLLLVTRDAAGSVSRRDVLGVAFVPLVAPGGARHG